MKKNFILTSFIFCIISLVYSQDYVPPMDIPLYLSGNFGELRTNHFHSGLDFKTQGITGIPVKAIKDGYVSRISISPYGYGRAIYVDHADGTTSIYAHLERFAGQIETFACDSQYIKKIFPINMKIIYGLFPVKKGEVIAYSGNTGSSGGPHLHFEIRDTKNNTIIDPLLLLKKEIADNRPPKIQSIMIYPQQGSGIVNNRTSKEVIDIKTDRKTREKNMSSSIEAWGMIGFGVKAYDYMDKTTNIYGVKEIILKVDSQVVFHSYINNFDFSDTRYINSFIDWEEWNYNKNFYMKSFIEPGNHLNIYKTKTNGLITIDQEKIYPATYILKDAYGNADTLSFNIQGIKQHIPSYQTKGILFEWNQNNEFSNNYVKLTIPKENLYTNIDFIYSSIPNYTGFSSLHKLGNQIPLHSYCPLTIAIEKDTFPNKEKYGIIFIKDKKKSWIGGIYKAGKISAKIRELGNYSITIDTMPPFIKEIKPTLWGKEKKISFTVKDDLSGISNWYASLDGKFVLFELDAKSSTLFCKYNPYRMEPGKKKLELWVEDYCGNRKHFQKTIVW